MNMIWLILGMAVVTYISRGLPAMLRLRFGKKFEKFLNLIPYTAMAALIFPGVLYVDESAMAVGAVGGLTALLLAWLKCPLLLVVVGAILADVLLYAFVLR